MGKTFDLAIVSKYRGPIYGFAILWVVLFHAWAIDGVDYSFDQDWLLPFKLFIDTGNVGVDIFLLLSGICMYFSWHRNPSVRDYLVKRASRIFLPVLVIDGIYWFARCILLHQMDGVSGFVSRISLMRFWMTGDSAVWFVSLLLPLYLLYPFIHAFLFSSESPHVTALKTGGLMLAVYLVLLSFWQDAPELFNQVEIALTRVPVFILGCGMGRAVYRGMRLPRVLAAVPVIGFFAFFAAWGFFDIEKPWSRFFYLIGGVSCCYTVAFLFAGIDKARTGKSIVVRGLSAVGGYSLELYLAHIMVNQVYRLTPFFIAGDLSNYFVVATVSLILAWATSRFIVNPLSKRLRKQA